MPPFPQCSILFKPMKLIPKAAAPIYRKVPKMNASGHLLEKGSGALPGKILDLGLLKIS